MSYWVTVKNLSDPPRDLAVRKPSSGGTVFSLIPKGAGEWTLVFESEDAYIRCSDLHGMVGSGLVREVWTPSDGGRKP